MNKLKNFMSKYVLNFVNLMAKVTLLHNCKLTCAWLLNFTLMTYYH